VEIDPESGTPIYLQLAAILRGQIQRGEIPADRALPSVKVLVQTYGVAQGTAEKAVGVLRDESLVHTVIGRGVFVTKR
jgi:DNA-binding GntR family transcriptional regulator